MKKYSFVLLVVAPTVFLAAFIYSSNRPKPQNDSAKAAEVHAALAQELSAERVAASASVAAGKSSAAIDGDSRLALSSSSSLSSSSLSSSLLSAASSRPAPYSYPRVAPQETIAKFLQDMDESALPKIDLPSLKKDEDFDYKKATPEQLKQKALEGDAVAAFSYAEAVKNGIFQFRSASIREKKSWDPADIKADIVEMRDFYMLALQGGVRQAAVALSAFYAEPALRSRVESLAWRKISFAVGESAQWDCLRDSTSCTVKEFNNLNGAEFFSICIHNGYYLCPPAMHQAAAALALDYMHNYQYSQ